MQCVSQHVQIKCLSQHIDLKWVGMVDSESVILLEGESKLS